MPAFGVIILDLHAEGGADAGEAVNHDADQGPVAQADQAVAVSSRPFGGPILSGMLSRSWRASSAVSTGVLPFLTTCLAARTAAAGLASIDLADDQPVEQHAEAARCCLTVGVAWPGRQLGR